MSVTRDQLEKISHDKNLYYPSSKEDVQTIINYARDNKYIVRTLGSEHSPTESIYTESDKQLKVILTGKLREIESFTIDEAKDAKTCAIVRVGAGCYLGINPKDKTSKLENSFNYQVHQKGFALPTLGGISHQTIAGFLSTSSSGGSPKVNIADAIEEIGFINGLGEYIRTKKGEDLFNAVGVSMGLLGIIVDVTFKLPKKYLVKGVESNDLVQYSCLSDSKDSYAELDKLLFNGPDFVHLNWYPYPNRVTTWQGNVVKEGSCFIKPYKHVLGSEPMTKTAEIVLKKTNELNEEEKDNSVLIALLQDPFAPVHLPPQKFCDISYKSLPIDDQVIGIEDRMSMDFTELWLPRNQLRLAMDKMFELYKNNPKAAGNLPTEIYPAKQSPFWFSPSYGHDAVRLDFWWWRQNKGDRYKFFGNFFEVLHDIPDIRFHPGKFLPRPGEKYGSYTFNPDDLQKNCPKLKDFLKKRDEMDPRQIFMTDYWRKYLGVPSPELGWYEYLNSYLRFNLFSRTASVTTPTLTPSESPALTMQNKG